MISLFRHELHRQFPSRRSHSGLKRLVNGSSPAERNLNAALDE